MPLYAVTMPGTATTASITYYYLMKMRWQYRPRQRTTTQQQEG